MRPNLYTCKNWLTDDGVQYLQSAHDYAYLNNISIRKARRILTKMVKHGTLEFKRRNNSNLPNNACSGLAGTEAADGEVIGVKRAESE